jgi:hypothetical protein
MKHTKATYQVNKNSEVKTVYLRATLGDYGFFGAIERTDELKKAFDKWRKKLMESTWRDIKVYPVVSEDSDNSDVANYIGGKTIEGYDASGNANIVFIDPIVIRGKNMPQLFFRQYSNMDGDELSMSVFSDAYGVRLTHSAATRIKEMLAHTAQHVINDPATLEQLKDDAIVEATKRVKTRLDVKTHELATALEEFGFPTLY